VSFGTSTGKTIQTLAAVFKLLDTNKIYNALFVVPASSFYQWEGEIERFTGLETALLRGPRKIRYMRYQEAKEAPLSLTTYESLRLDVDFLKKHLQWDVVVFDEATFIKNPKTQSHLAAKVVANKAKSVFLLTATPLQNALEELHAIFSVLDPSILGTLDDFKKKYCDYQFEEIWVKRRDPRTRRLVPKKQWIAKLVGYKNLSEVTGMIDLHYLKRSKKEVLPDLPEIIRQDRWIDMAPKQRAAYKQVATGMLNGEQLHVFQELMLLMQICDTPEVVDADVKDSAKIEDIRHLLTSDLFGEKVVLFTRFRVMMRRLEALMGELGLKYIKISGDDSDMVLRNKRREQFQEDPETKIALISLAGEMSLNLQAAGVLIKVDQLWNPKRMEQVEGRVHRIGSKHDKCLMINLLCKNTIEERIMEVLAKKEGLFNAVFGTSEVTDKLTKSEVVELVRSTL